MKEGGILDRDDALIGVVAAIKTPYGSALEITNVTQKEKDMIRALFLRDDNYKFDKLSNDVSIDEYWKRGIALYNDIRHRINIEELKRMKD